MTEVLSAGVFVAVALYIFAPYWYRRGWWRMPEQRGTEPLQARVNCLREELEAMAFDEDAGRVASEDSKGAQLRRELELDRLGKELARHGGMRAGALLPPEIKHARCCEECGTKCRAGSRFCSECGAALRTLVATQRSDTEAKQARGKIVPLKGLILVGLMLGAQSALAQPAMRPPHESMPTGVISGTLQIERNGTVEMLKNHPFNVQVRTGPTILVNVEKKSDAKGQYQIRNVLPMQELAYFVQVNEGGRLFESPPLRLPDGEEKLTANVVLREITTAAAPMEMSPPTMPPPSAVRITNPKGGKLASWGRYQQLSLGLCGVVFLMIIMQKVWFRRKKSV